MKHAILLSLLLTAVCAAVGQPAVAPNTIVVRLANGHPDLSSWLTNDRTGELPSLRTILGPHRTHGFVSSATLKAVTKARRGKDESTLLEQKLRPIERIVVITTDHTIDPLMLSRKISAMNGIDYAEPMPVHEIIGIPNDPGVAQQYYLATVKAIEAWDLLPDRPDVLVGIIDTGIDTTHADLGANVFRHAGEMGQDGQGRDKRTNGIDDDNNGFIDDWYGWDFVGADGNSPDNTPLPGHPHGTHVGGTVGAIINNEFGIAGVAQKVKVLAVKVGRDNVNARSVEKTSDGILYAAAMGASVINCSFGSSSRSFADLDVIEEALELGALVVAAAGNDGLEQGFYPAAHPPCVSVAATDEDDVRTFFSNFHSTVDVCAPGQSILSTVPGGKFEFYDGTSMASPIVAAIAAMTKLANPSLTPDQLRAVVKANTDNIDTLNVSFVGRLGTGRVNAFSAVQRQHKKFVEVAHYSIIDDDADSIFSPGDELSVTLSAANLLDPLINGRIVVTTAPSDVQPIFDVSTADLGPMPTGDTADASNTITFTLPDDVPLNGTLALLITFYDGDTVVGREMINATVNPSFRTFTYNDVRTTVNSEGNIGYNDYPENLQGVGYRHQNKRSILFEGGFLVGISPTYLPNVVRGANTSYRDYSMEVDEVVTLGVEPTSGYSGAFTGYTDGNDRYNLGLHIDQQVLQPAVDSLRSTTFVIYNITNTSDTTITGLHAALFMDWDLGTAGEGDGCAWVHDAGLGVVQNTKDPSIPTVGVAMLSPLTMHFYALDNAGDGILIPSIYDNFLRAEKWMFMSSGIARTNSRITDVSMMIGGGPFTLMPDSTQQIVFAINADAGFTASVDQMKRARAAAQANGWNATDYVPISQVDRILYLEGGPAVFPGPHQLRFELSSSSPVTIDIVDIMGRPIGTMVDELNLTAGIHERVIDIPSSATGVYFIRMVTYFGTQTMPIQIAP